MTTTKGTLVATSSLPTATLVRNILKTYRSATDAQLAQGMTWYEEAHALALVLDPADPARAAVLTRTFQITVPFSIDAPSRPG
jgi:hypothetical protein